MLYPYFKTINGERRYGFMTNEGIIRIDPIYEYAGSFSDGLGLVFDGECYRFVDTNGRIVIDLEFAYATPFSEGLAFVNYQNICCFIDTSGDIVINTGIPFLQDSYAYPFKNGVTVLCV